MTDHRFSLTFGFLTVEVMNTPDLHLLAMEIESHGFAGHDEALLAITRSARSAGLSPVLLDILGDPTAPEVARLRAFGRLTAGLGGRALAKATTRPGRRVFRRAA
jgi:hypothetical protein